MPLGIGDLAALPQPLLAIFGKQLPARGDRRASAPLKVPKLERSSPPRALAVGIPFIGLRRRDVQDARKFRLGSSFTGMDSDYRRSINSMTGELQIADLYAAVMHRTNCSIWWRNPIGDSAALRPAIAKAPRCCEAVRWQHR